MIVSRLILKNWRNFKEVDVELKDRMFIIGPNASGKSNLLDVFRFLRDIAKPGGGLQKAVQDRCGLSKIRCLAAREHPDVEIEVHLLESNGTKHTWKYAIGIKQEVRGHRNPLLVYEKVWKDDKQLINRPDKEDKNDSVRLTQTYLEQINSNKKFRDIFDYFKSVVYLHIVPQLIRNSEAFSGPGIPGDPFGRNFLERITQASEKTRKSRLQKIEKALQVAVPQLKQLSLIKDENGVPHLEVVYTHWRPQGAKQREDQFSDGTLRLIGLLWSLLEGDSLLLLEEPELSLHSAIVSKIPVLMHKLQRQKKRQIILSTHSADILSDKGIGGEEVLLLTPGKEGTKVEVSSNIQDARVLLESGGSVADALLSKTVPSNLEQLNFFK